ncbi:hypothetical protein RchiOBHm_Chr7g0206301 [Rosa chinensis]|uniref:Uncharacterized protein n=1 Tax=Rosa chinensis TaxID=74649 RepID=A0A2P6P947_ROSCH|nr:inner centromere protein [Rosa chinensis]XP_024175126.1 inner centromere protein [Rosa chinensis]XP_024175130.1 inner centromere protein [Rosa chinensis]XP_040367767.1 inner centromere protein [Rosa chinensis]XP_040367768.1 inner centromere protein [Rosa chinensis]XP_040367769.1 inner centromere protein [Rosa chinensis]PRQ18463.1 hypothetical protein RchiOBHm_Chr7g0206301 [Rosa chinensis]
MCSPPSAMEKGGTRKRPRPSNPSCNQLRSFAHRRFNSGTGPSSPTKAFHGGPGQVPFQAVSPHGKAKKARTEEKDHEFQKSSPLHPQPSETEETSEYLRDFQEISDKHKSLVSLFTSCMRSISPEEVNKVEPLELCQKSVSMNLNAVYYQHGAMEYLERVHYELSGLRIEKKMLQDSNLKLENDLLTEKSEAREAKAQIELEMIKERKRAEEEKVRADTLVAQIELEMIKERKRAEEEKVRADTLVAQIELEMIKERKRAEEEKVRADTLVAQIELEMIKERKRAEEEKVRADTLVAQIELEMIKERKRAEEEKVRADTLVAQIELEMIKERKRAEEEKVRADTLVAQIEKLLVELQKAKAALEEEKEKVSKLSEGIPALEVASVQAFKESKEFTNLMFEQFARGYDDCRTVIEEHNFRLDLSWMDVEDVTNERILS